MEYAVDAATSHTPKAYPDCNKAAHAAVTNMIKMLQRYGFDEREITLALADAVDEHILTLSKQ